MDRVRIMVTGGRDWTDAEAIAEALMMVQITEAGPFVLMHGDCRDKKTGEPCGADAIADRLAREMDWVVEKYPADWYNLGLAAGGIRNTAMVARRPDLVLAFPMPRSRGTWDAVNKARMAGIRVVVDRRHQ